MTPWLRASTCYKLCTVWMYRPMHGAITQRPKKRHVSVWFQPELAVLKLYHNTEKNILSPIHIASNDLKTQDISILQINPSSCPSSLLRALKNNLKSPQQAFKMVIKCKIPGHALRSWKSHQGSWNLLVVFAAARHFASSLAVVYVTQSI